MHSSIIPDIDPHDYPCTICISKAEKEEHLGKMMEEFYENYSTSQDFEGSDILWLYGEEMGEYDREMFIEFNGYINKIYGTMIFKYKDLQYTIMNQCKKYHADKYGFHPSSYALMREVDLLQEDVRSSGKSKSWIAKPSHGGEGQDIFCFETVEELMAKGVKEGMVAQEYIHNPLTIKNRKWDARIFIIIHGVNPMRGYIGYDTGFARLCTAEYDRNDVFNPHSTITNRHRNVDNPNYLPEGEEDGDENLVYQRYSLSRGWELALESQENPEADLEKIKEAVKGLGNSILRCYRSSIEAEHADFMEMDGTREQNDKLFNILGLDVMFDADLKPWLLETNRNPGMTTSLVVLNDEGEMISKTSKIATEVRGNLINEITRILLGKEDSKKFTKCYDNSDPETGDADFIYERVFQIFKGIGGKKLKRALSVHDFVTFVSSLPEDLAEDIRSDEVVNKLTLKNKSEITLPEFFSGLEILSESVSMSLPSFLTRVEGE